MKTEILKIKGDWLEVLNDCRSTVSKPEAGKEPSERFKKQMLIAEHSPIRDIIFKWRWSGIKSWIATHWSRHKFECYISTQRADRTGKNRDELPQAAPVTFVGDANIQSLIDTMRKRLCYQAADETREYAVDLKDAIALRDADVSDVLVPNCIYRCGCPEPQTCGEWHRFRKWIADQDTAQALTDIRKRYELYEQYRHREQ